MNFGWRSGCLCVVGVSAKHYMRVHLNYMGIASQPIPCSKEGSLLGSLRHVYKSAGQ
jgi:hypothetical protein